MLVLSCLRLRCNFVALNKVLKGKIVDKQCTLCYTTTDVKDFKIWILKKFMTAIGYVDWDSYPQRLFVKNWKSCGKFEVQNSIFHKKPLQRSE